MKRIALICILLIACFCVPYFSWGENFPAVRSDTPPPAKVAPPQPRIFYGYVPPPPIRHTWPGGYRVIFSELMNTFVEHMLGQY
jgi:hypothetical protein